MISGLLPLRFARAWMITGVVLLGVILALALSPTPPGIPFNPSDKLVHGLAFVFLMTWFSGLVEVRLAPALALCLAAYGLLIELLQGQTATRQADALDLAADIVGILLGWLLCGAGLRRWCTWLESWLAPEHP